jgi:hypothetical protein
MIVNKAERSAIVITHTGPGDRVIEAPWIEIGFNIATSDWIVLSADGWRAVAEGDPVVWEALERKLFIGSYVSQPRLVAVIGHPGGRREHDPEMSGRSEVGRIVRRIRSLLLPTEVVGFWSDEGGWLRDFVEPDEIADGDPPHVDPAELEEPELIGGSRA